MAKAETDIKEVTVIDVIPTEVDLVQNGINGDNCNQVIIMLDSECREWFDGRADLEIKALIDTQARADEHD